MNHEYEKKNICKASFTGWKAHIHFVVLPNLFCEGDILHFYPYPMRIMTWNCGHYTKLNY